MSPIEKAAKAVGDAILAQDSREFQRVILNGTEYISCDAANSGLEPEAIARAVITAYLEACVEDVMTRAHLAETLCKHEWEWDSGGQTMAAILALVPGRE